MSFNMDNYSLEDIITNLWCVIDTVTGLTHIGVLVNESDNTTIVLHCPRCVIENEKTNQVVLTQPMYIGSPKGVFKLNCNTANIQFSPCDEVVEAYIKSLMQAEESLSSDMYTIDAIQ